MSKILYGLHPSEYEHPLDREALKVLQNVSGLAVLLDKIQQSPWEKSHRIQLQGMSTKITNGNFPHVHKLFMKACKILDFPNPPDLYTVWEHSINAYAFGVTNPTITLHSVLIDTMNDDELLFFMGHELGHIKSGFLMYYELAKYFLPLLINNIPIPNVPIVGKVIVETIQYPLYNWKRMQELSCDRAGLLCCQNKDAAFRALIALSGVPLKYHKEDFVNEFIKQAVEFQTVSFDPADKIIKKFSQAYSFDHAILNNQLIPQSHPFPVLRLSRIIEWIESGDYEKIINSDRNTIQSSFCPNCRASINKEDMFCGNCGTKLANN